METRSFSQLVLTGSLVVACLVGNDNRCRSAQPKPQNSEASSSSAESQKLAESCDTCTIKPIYRKTTPYQKKPSLPTVDWTTMPSTYTHSPAGDRVDQFAESQLPLTVEHPPVVRSGFRHSRSTLQAGFSSDNYHSVEQWGPNVRPYGEWRYPTRPFSVPYNAWGPQLPLAVGGFPWGGFHGPIPPTAGPGLPPPIPQGPVPPSFPGQGWFGVGPNNALLPTQDDYYPQAPTLYPLNSGLE